MIPLPSGANMALSVLYPREGFLRAPPFTANVPPLSVPCHTGPEADSVSVVPPELAATICQARIGGSFWAPRPSFGRPIILALCSRVSAQAAEPFVSGLMRRFPAQALLLVTAAANHGARRLARRTGIAEILLPADPHGLLDHAEEIHQLGPGDIAILGALRGLPTRWYARPQDTDGHVLTSQDIRTGLAQACRYVDPFTGMPATLAATIDLLLLWKDILTQNRKIALCGGMSLWKRRRMARFFSSAPGHPPFGNRVSAAVRASLAHGGTQAIAAWATRIPHRLETTIRREEVPLWRVEDGFVRSVGLGSDLRTPASIILDKRGIYYDPRQPSDLEHILATTLFDDRIRQRARTIIDRLIRDGISKYGRSAGGGSRPDWPAQTSRTVILVPGQVADDLSVRCGGGEIQGNLALLQAVRERNPAAFVIYRPHPDVDAGHREGRLDDAIIRRYADHVSRGGAITAAVSHVDEVHTLTSLAGFEALLRGVKVVTYGVPFYAGWGLTIDRGIIPARRNRTLTIEELAAGTLLIYPRYLDPVTELPCPLETLLSRLGDEKLWRPTPLMRVRRLQGRMKTLIAAGRRRQAYKNQGSERPA